MNKLTHDDEFSNKHENQLICDCGGVMQVISNSRLACPFCGSWSTGLDEYVCGFIDSSVYEVLEKLSAIYSNHAICGRCGDVTHALVTTLDSSHDVVSIGRVNKVLSGGTPVGSGVVLPISDLLSGIDSVFFGFDEVWLFSKVVTIAKPSDISLVTPGGVLGKSLSDLVQWMDITSCVAGFGDGCGLNFVVRNRRREFSIDKLVELLN